MKKNLLLLSFIVLAMLSIAQETKKVAILETINKTDDVSYGIKLQVRSSLTFAIQHTPGYEGFDRVDINSILNEQDFQRTGMVSTEEIKRLGEMTGAQYILLAEVAKYDEQNILLTAKILDVETGGVANASLPIITSKESDKIQEACRKVAIALLGELTPISKTHKRKITTPFGNDDYTETAWGIDMNFVWVEGGDFLMGCTSEQENCYDDEKTIRRVSIDGFYICKFETTQSQWNKVMGTSISQQRDKASTSWGIYGNKDDSPIYYVSWDEALEFCRLLSNKTGLNFTLPTEAQWEYAARGGRFSNMTTFAGSNTYGDVAWTNTNSDGTTHLCGKKQANELGLYDMSGNVQEWCLDYYSSSYDKYDTENPLGAKMGNYHVIRGGSWNQIPRASRVSNRNFEMSTYRYYNLGFRVVLLP